mmetsp:Transcript_2396/g.4247  ORF Transcript_2396/g.4247 Transcript_2396/m.4247 type:complete len:210 (-) Transcript_2396:12-641(-)
MFIICTVVLAAWMMAFSVEGWRIPLKTAPRRQFIQPLHSNAALEDPDDKINMENYMKGTMPWKGTRDILPRKKQIPSKEYSATSVVRKILDALQINDDPQLDHGCCVLLEFKSPSGPLAKTDLDPAAYGRFLRNTEYGLLIDHTVSTLVGEPEELSDSLSIRQKVTIKGYGSDDMGPRELKELDFDFYLTNVESTWLLDVILLSRLRDT